MAATNTNFIIEQPQDHIGYAIMMRGAKHPDFWPEDMEAMSGPSFSTLPALDQGELPHNRAKVRRRAA